MGLAVVARAGFRRTVNPLSSETRMNADLPEHLGHSSPSHAPPVPASWSWKIRVAEWRSALGVLAVLVFFGGPLLMLLAGAWRSAPPGQGGSWTAAAWWVVGQDGGVLRALGNSLILCLNNLLVALPLAAVLAFVAQRTDCSGRRWITPAMLIMFAMPSLFYAMGYSLLANPYTGLLNVLANKAGFSPGWRVNIESWSGLALVNTFRCVAFIYLFLLGPFRALAVEQEEASMVAGRGPVATFLRVSLPALLPALAGAAIFAIIGGLEVFDLALIIGVPANVPVLAVRIFDWLGGTTPPNYGAATVLSSLLVLVVGGLILVQRKLLGRRSFVSITGKAVQHKVIALGRWRPVAGAVVWGYLVVAQLLPIGALVYASFQPFPGVVGALSVKHYAAVWASPEIHQALGNTLLLAAVTGAITALAGLLIAELERQVRPGAARLVRVLGMAPLAMPGVVMALAITWAYVATPGLRGLYGTLWMMLIALVVSLMPLAIQMGQASLAQISPQLSEAARVAGAGPARSWLLVVLRLSLPGFLVGWFLAAVAVCGSLDIPLLLGGPGLSTLATTIYTLNIRGQVGMACALLCLLLLLILMSALLFALVRHARRFVVKGKEGMS